MLNLTRQTDSTGSLVLGELKAITQIEARCIESGMKRSWDIQNFHGNSSFEVPMRVKADSGTDVWIPIPVSDIPFDEYGKGEVLSVNMNCRYIQKLNILPLQGYL